MRIRDSSRGSRVPCSLLRMPEKAGARATPVLRGISWESIFPMSGPDPIRRQWCADEIRRLREKLAEDPGAGNRQNNRHGLRIAFPGLCHGSRERLSGNPGRRRFLEEGAGFQIRLHLPYGLLLLRSGYGIFRGPQLRDSVSDGKRANTLIPGPHTASITLDFLNRDTGYAVSTLGKCFRTGNRSVTWAVDTDFVSPNQLNSAPLDLAAVGGKAVIVTGKRGFISRREETSGTTGVRYRAGAGPAKRSRFRHFRMDGHVLRKAISSWSGPG